MNKRIGLIGSVPEPSGGSGVAPELRPLLPRGVDLVPYSSRVAAFPYTPLERLLQEIGHADAAFTAAEDGCDAVAIDSVGDYGLEAMRASLPVPAIGAGEAGMAAAAAGGRRFAIVTVWPASMNFILEGRLRAYGHAAVCSGILNVGAEHDVETASDTTDYLSRVRSGQARLRAAIMEAVELAALDGAGTVLLGCTCMSRMASGLQAAAPVPVINPLAAAVEAAVRARPQTPPAVRAGRRTLVRQMVESAAGGAAEPCPVCIAGDGQ